MPSEVFFSWEYLLIWFDFVGMSKDIPIKMDYTIKGTFMTLHMEFSAIFKKNEGIILEKVDDAYLLMLDSDDEGKGIYISNTAVEIFDLCDGGHSIKDLIVIIMSEYDVDFDTCAADVKSCVESLVLQGILLQV